MSTDIFTYTVAIKLALSSNRLNLLQEEYPGATDLTLASRDFSDYGGCVTSCKQLMDDLCKKANVAAPDPVYTISSEVNPVHTGIPVMSNDWTASELARVWVFDGTMDKSRQIQAIGQARIFKSVLSSQQLLN